MGALWWTELPRRAGRLWAPLFGVLSDGAYVTVWPTVAAWTPLLALALGLVLGARRPESWVVPTSSIAMLAVLVTVGGFGAALGAWLSVGYAVGDFVLRRHPVSEGHTAYDLYALTHIRAPLLIAYVLVAVLAVLVPLGSRLLSESAALGIRPDTPRAGTIRKVAHTVLVSAFTAAWLISAPLLLRPVFTWQRVTPPAAIMLSPFVVGVVALLAAGVAFTRDGFESMAATRSGHVRMQADALRGQAAPMPSAKPLRAEASLIAGAALGTFLLAGLLHSPVDAIVMGSVLLLVGVLRGSMTQATSWNALVSRVPPVPRLIGSVILGGIVARVMIGVLRQQLPASLPMACAIGGSLCVAAVLMGGRGSASTSPARARAGSDRKVAVSRSDPAGKPDPARPVAVSSSPVSASPAR